MFCGSMIGKRVYFEGRVQGVGFRYAAKDLAKGYDVVGTVRNCEDGGVEVLVQGEAEEVAAYLQDLSEESDVAHHIKEMRTEEIVPLQDQCGFIIVS